MRRPAHLLLLLSALVVGCVDASEHSASNDVTGTGSPAIQGGLPQRVWMRYALHDIAGNPLPAFYGDSTGATYRVYADTLSFVFGTGEFREVAIIARVLPGAPDQLVRVTSAPGLAWTRTPTELILFPSVLFGPSTGTLSGATREQPFSPLLSAASVSANYVWY